ncbi:MAG TPA: NUDIX hydrolase [Jiangellaceae bacterium]|nr:NUDIX hydrolase [Jiangellaceae bacterium]
MVRDLSAARATVVAAGAVLWRMRDTRLEICIIHRPKYDDWTLPKGKVKDGEHILTAAVREVEEETGQRVFLGRPLPSQRYLVAEGPKIVHYWAAHAPDGTHDWQPNHEVDRVEFLPAGEAVGRLSYRHDAEVAAELIEGPLQTAPLVLLRHTTSVNRSDFDGPDGGRPLSPQGAAEAERLTSVLAAYGPLRVVSSDAARCTESVRPYAEHHKLAIEVDHALSESGHEAKQAASLVHRLLADAEPALICSHRPVLPDLLAAATARVQVAVPTEQLPPGGFHVLHHRDRVVVGIETHTV